MRLRSDGSNEISGVTPDILLPWTDRDSRYQQALKRNRLMDDDDSGGNSKCSLSLGKFTKAFLTNAFQPSPVTPSGNG